jgi:uncharacterized integral membrane protein
MSKFNRAKVLAALVILLLLVILGVQNSQPVAIRIFFWQARVDGLLLFAVLFVAGILVGLLVPRLWRRTHGGTGEDR